MEKKSLIVVSIALVLLGAGWGIHQLISGSTKKPEAYGETKRTQVVDIDAVVNAPEKFAGFIGVEGTVTKIDEKNSAFTLGCEDECFAMPVRFGGHAPKEGTKVIAYGEVKKAADAKYVFVAQEIQAR